MRNHRNRNRRARDAAAEDLFTQALLGAEPGERKAFDPQTDRKTRQLCRQVQRALMMALDGECHDDVLREVYVESVDPIGTSAQLLVRVAAPARLVVTDVLERLNDHAPTLRVIVARAICRKRVPALSFVVFPAGADLQGGAP